MALYLGHGRSHQAEAEKPFWISFSDLMTALMVLFLVAMAVAIHEVKAGVDNANAAANHRSASIRACMDEVQSATRNIPGVTVKEYSIDFGSRANFQLNRYDLTPDAGRGTARLCPSGRRDYQRPGMRPMAQTSSGRWFRQQRGNLSPQPRSQY